MTSTPAFDAESFKRATLNQWEKTAAGWNDRTPPIRVWLRSATEAMLGMAGIKRGSRVLDVAVCRLGLMLFRGPLQGLRQMYRALKSGSGVCTMVFSTPDANPCIAILMSTALQHAGLPSRDPYQPGGLLSLGKPGLIDELFKTPGF